MGVEKKNLEPRFWIPARIDVESLIRNCDSRENRRDKVSEGYLFHSVYAMKNKRGVCGPRMRSTPKSSVPRRLTTSSTDPTRVQRRKTSIARSRTLAIPAIPTRAKGKGQEDRFEEGEDELDSPVSGGYGTTTTSHSQDEDRLSMSMTDFSPLRKSPRRSDAIRNVAIPLTCPDPSSSTVLALGLSLQSNVKPNPGTVGAFTLTHEDVIRFRTGKYKKHESSLSKRGSEWRRITIHDAATRRLEEVLGSNKAMGSLATSAYDGQGHREWLFALVRQKGGWVIRSTDSPDSL